MESRIVYTFISLYSTITLLGKTKVTICNKTLVVPLQNKDGYIENELENNLSLSEAMKENWQQLLLTSCIMGYN